MNKNHLAIVELVLTHIHENYDEWTGPGDIHLCATKQFDFEISVEEVTEVLRQMLIRHYVNYPLEDLFRGHETEAYADLQKIFPGIDSGAAFRAFPWQQIGFTQLQQVHSVLDVYGANNLFYEDPEGES